VLRDTIEFAQSTIGKLREVPLVGLAPPRGEIPSVHPLPNGPWIFVRSDVVGTAAAEHLAARASVYRGGKNAGPNSNQLHPRIPRT